MSIIKSIVEAKVHSQNRDQSHWNRLIAVIPTVWFVGVSADKKAVPQYRPRPSLTASARDLGIVGHKAAAENL